MADRLPNVGFVKGVCAGWAYEHGVPVCIVRAIVFVACCFLPPLAILYYASYMLGQTEYYTPLDYKDRTSLFGLFVD